MYSRPARPGVDEGAPKVVLPPAVRNAGWPQAGGNPAHLMGHLAANDHLAEAWKAEIGEGGGYRQDHHGTTGRAERHGLHHGFGRRSVGVFAGRRQAPLARRYQAEGSLTAPMSAAAWGSMVRTLYAVNGLSSLVALDVATGKEKWRATSGVPGRSAPMIADGRVFVTTIDDRLLAFTAADGRQLWTHQAAEPVTSMLGSPPPAYYRGLVVAGFGSGELACLRADSGSVVWTDGLGASEGRAAVADLLSIRGLPVIVNGLVYAISMGGLLVCNDVPSGRRVWERQVAGEDTPYIAGDWMFVISAEQQIAAININDGRVAWITELAALGGRGQAKEHPDMVRPVAGQRPSDRDRRQQGCFVDQPLHRRNSRPYQLSAAAAPLVPVVADGTVLIVTNDGRLLALR